MLKAFTALVLILILGISAIYLYSMSKGGDEYANLYEKAVMAKNGGDNDKALYIFKKLLERDRHDEKSIVSIAEIYEALGEDNKALEYWEYAIHLNPLENKYIERVKELRGKLKQ